MKEQGNNPQEQTNEEEIGSLSIWKRIQSYDNKDDPKSWK